MAKIWLSQAATEARVATSFGRIHQSLVALGADAGLIALSARAVDDEHRHVALRGLLEEEVDHARVGWAFLASSDASIRDQVSDWLLPLAVCNLREWRRLDLPDDQSLAALGVPQRSDAHEALTDALRGVLVPGFAHVGFDTTALERWIAQGAPV
jgi:hypothetical protein